MSGSCEKCLKGITKGRYPGVKCVMCVSLFHIKCADISEVVLKELESGSTTWVCPDCRSQANNSVIDDNVESLNASSGSIKSNTSLSDLVIILQGMQSQLDAVKNSLTFLCQTFEDIKITINKLTKDSQLFTEKICKLESKFSSHEDKINTLEALIDRQAQEANLCNIVFCGLPLNCNNITGLVINICGMIGVRVMKEDILSITKMVHNNESVSFLKNSFITKFATSELTNNILTSFRRKKLCINELGDEYSMYPPNQRILLLHHFTRFQSRLYNAAKSIKNEYKFQFLWCKNNNIYLRKTADSKVHQIFSFNDIRRLESILHSSGSPIIHTTGTIHHNELSSNRAET